MWPHFWHFGRAYRPAYAAGLLLLVLANLLSLGIPWLLREAVRALERGEASRRVALLAAGMIALAAGQAIVRTWSRLAILGASRRVVYDIRNRFFGQLLRLDPSFYDRFRTGDIMSRGVNDLQLLRSLYGPGVLNAMNTVIVYVAVVIVLFSIDLMLTAVSMVLYPLLFFGVNRLSRLVYARSREVQEQLATISNRAQENFSGIKQIKAYVQEEREIAAFAASCDEFRRRNLSMAALRGAMLSLFGVIAGAGTLLVVWIGGRQVISGNMDLAEFVAFNAYLGLLAWPTIAFGWIVNVFQRGIGAMERVQDVLALEPEIASPLDDPQSPAAAPAARPAAGLPGSAPPGRANVLDERTGAEAAPRRTAPRIEIRDLTFRHPTAHEPALRGVTLTIEPGESIGLVGAVGAGKSTLADLVARVYPAPPGSIFLDGEDISALPAARVRSLIGYAPQDAFLFSRSLRDNVALRTPDAPFNEVLEAIHTAQLARDVDELPEGLDTVVGERGFTLSGGQRQRAALARTLLGEPPVLILDDSLASVDADTEHAILDRLVGARRARTCLFITHRLPSVAAMDRVAVLAGGRLVELGTHEQLLAHGGTYARLVERYRLERRLGAS